MVFVGEATRDGGLCMRKGEFKIYTQGIGGEETASGLSRPELAVRLAAMGLKIRQFPCDSYYDS